MYRMFGIDDMKRIVTKLAFDFKKINDFLFPGRFIDIKIEYK